MAHVQHAKGAVEREGAETKVKVKAHAFECCAVVCWDVLLLNSQMYTTRGNSQMHTTNYVWKSGGGWRCYVVSTRINIIALYLYCIIPT